MTAGSDDPATSGSFVRGLTLGALLGAAIAGSSLWSRRRRRARLAAADARAAHRESQADPGTPEAQVPKARLPEPQSPEAGARP